MVTIIHLNDNVACKFKNNHSLNGNILQSARDLRKLFHNDKCLLMIYNLTLIRQQSTNGYLGSHQVLLVI